MYFNPDRMPTADRQRVDRWLAANGCRHHVALEPIIVRGKVAEYTALCRKGRESALRFTDVAAIPLGRKRLRIRIPLHCIA